MMRPDAWHRIKFRGNPGWRPARSAPKQAPFNCSGILFQSHARSIHSLLWFAVDLDKSERYSPSDLQTDGNCHSGVIPWTVDWMASAASENIQPSWPDGKGTHQLGGIRSVESFQ